VPTNVFVGVIGNTYEIWRIFTSRIPKNLWSWKTHAIRKKCLSIYSLKKYLIFTVYRCSVLPVPSAQWTRQQNGVSDRLLSRSCW